MWSDWTRDHAEACTRLTLFDLTGSPSERDYPDHFVIKNCFIPSGVPPLLPLSSPDFVVKCMLWKLKKQSFP